MTISRTRLLSATILSLLILSACSSKSDGPAAAKPGGLLDNSTPNHAWYCYGENNGGDWSCGQTQDSNKIQSIPAKSHSLASNKTNLKTNLPNSVQISELSPVKNATIEVLEKLEKVFTSIEEKIQSLPDANYIIQLTASKSRHDAAQLAIDMSLSEAMIVSTKTKDETWFVLLLGNFEKYSHAKNMRDKLVTQNSRLKPWIRDIKSLKKAIQRAEK